MEPLSASEEKLLQLVKDLPEAQLAKVISMVEGLKKEDYNFEQNDYKKAIDEAVGKFKGKFSTVDEFMKRKSEEKELDL